MGDFIERAKRVLKEQKMRGFQSVQEAFPRMVQMYPPQNVRSGHCRVSCVPLSQQEMYPPGRCPRHLNQEVYDFIRTRPNRAFCYTCGIDLSQKKVSYQYKEPRDLKHFYCKYCWPYEILMAGLVHGMPEVEAFCFQQPQPLSQVQQHGQPYFQQKLNMTPEEFAQLLRRIVQQGGFEPYQPSPPDLNDTRRIYALPQGDQARLQIPFTPVQSVEDMLRNMRIQSQDSDLVLIEPKRKS